MNVEVVQGSASIAKVYCHAISPASPAAFCIQLCVAISSIELSTPLHVIHIILLLSIGFSIRTVGGSGVAEAPGVIVTVAVLTEGDARSMVGLCLGAAAAATVVTT